MASDRMHVSLVEVQTQWSIEDVWQAHEVLDMYRKLDNKVAISKPRRR